MKKRIELDEKYFIRTDNVHGWQLVSISEKTIQKGKRKGQVTIKEDVFYYPNLGQCLDKFLELSLQDCEDVKDIKDNLSEIKNKIADLRNVYAKKGNII